MAKSGAQTLSNIYTQRAYEAYQSDIQRRQNALKKAEAEKAAESKNNGGLLGGLGYLGEKLFLGTASSLEGITDYTIGGFAKLFGADELAEDIFDNDWLNYSHADEWFNPGEGWEFAGDIAGGIGSSVPAVVGAGLVGAATGGTALPAAASFLTAGLGAAGNATKEAYRETGELGGKEFGYGAIMGAIEGGVEAASTLVGLGGGRAVKKIATSFGKESGEAAIKSASKVTGSKTWKIIKDIASDFASEGAEEGITEHLTPIAKRATYDPDAKSATIGEISYAALVGGISGIIMNGATTGATGLKNLKKGNQLINDGETEGILRDAKGFAEYQKKNNSDNETYKYITEKYDALTASVANTGGKIVNPSQRMLLAELNRGVEVAAVQNAVRKSAANIVSNPEAIVERLNKYGYKDADGKAYTYIVKDIMAGIDLKKPESIIKALQSNSVLRELAIADTVGHMMIDAENFANSVMQGDKLFSQVDLNRFLAQADEREIAQVGEVLGIKDWNTVDADGLRQAIQGFVDEGGITVWKSRNALRKNLEALTPETKGIPFRVAMENGDSKRYSDGNVDVAITKNDGVYTLYDYDTGLLSRHLSQSDVNTLLNEYSERKAEITAYAKEQIAIAERAKAEDIEIDTYARENISDYSSLSEPNQGMIKKLIREGRANNIESDTLLTAARVSARSGLDIVFDSEKAGAKGAKISGNTVYIDPEGPKERMRAKLLLHEVGHAIFRDAKLAKTFDKILKQVKPKRYAEIAKRYSDMYRAKNVNFSAYAPIVQEEIIMHHIEDVLCNVNVWDYILKEDMSVKDKFLSFLGKQTEAYAGDEKLSRTAKKLFDTYKKMFAELAARNSQSNAYGDRLTGVNPENMHDSERYAFEGYAEDGRGKYRSNFPKGTPKNAKSERVLFYIQNVWSKKPIKLNITDEEGNVIRTIEAEFDPTYDETGNEISDATKLMGGNRHGNAAEKRVTLDLADDYYQIASESKYNYSKNETGKDLSTHEDVKEWHYFVNDIYFAEYDSNKFEPYRVTINVKEKADGSFVYSFSAEKNNETITPRTLHAAVKGTESSPNNRLVDNSISQTTEKSNTSDEKFLKERSVLPDDRDYMSAVERGDMETAQRMVDEAARVWAEENGVSYALLDGTYNAQISESTGEVIGYEEIYESSREIQSYGTDFDENTLIPLYRSGSATIWGPRKNTYGIQGTYLTDSEIVARGFAASEHKVGNIIRVYAKAKKPLIVNARGRNYTDIPTESMPRWLRDSYSGTADADSLPNKAFSRGYDAVIIQNVKEGVGGGVNTDVIIYDGRVQMKSADPVTYDDNGNVIPLSERFNPQKSDIRYALPENDPFIDDIFGGNSETSENFDNPSGAEMLDSLNPGWREEMDANLKAQNTEANEPKSAPRAKNKASDTVRERRESLEKNGQRKVYSRKEARELTKRLKGVDGLSPAVREEMSDAIWRILNDAESETERRELAHGMAETVVDRVLADSVTENPDALEAGDRLSYLSTGIGRLDFTPSEIDEIKHRVDVKGLRSIRGRWGYKGARIVDGATNITASRRVALDEFVTSIAREMPGMEYLEDMNYIDAFFEVDAAYSAAKEAAGDKWIGKYWDTPDSEIPDMIKGVEDSILEAYYNGGVETAKSIIGNRLDAAVKEAAFWKSEHRKLSEKRDTRYQKYREARERTQNKASLYRAVSRLNTRLFKPTKEKNIHYSMQPFVAEALSKLNLDTGAMEQLISVQEEIERLYRADNPDYEKIGKLEYKRDKLEVKALKLTESMKALSEAYKKFGEGDSIAKNAFDIDVSAKLDEFIEKVGDTPINKMTAEQMSAARQFYELLLHRINGANELFREGKAKTVEETAESIIGEVKDSKPLGFLYGENVVSTKFRNTTKEFLVNNMKPPHLFDTLGSKTLTAVYEGLHQGELIWGRDVKEAKDFFDKCAEKYNFYSWDTKSRTEFLSLNGRKFSLTLGQRMSLYAYLKRENSHAHLKEGGFKFAPDTPIEDGKIITRYLNDATQYTVNEDILKRIADSLTEEQRKFADEMQDYLSNELAAKGNEVSRILYGIDLFTEKNYFPMKCANEYLESQTGKQGDPKIKNKGMAKPVTPHAENPLILGDFLDVWSRHVNDMAQYHGMVLPTENMNRLLNFVEVRDAQTEADAVKDAKTAGEALDVLNKEGRLGDSLKQVMQEKYGSEVTTYIEKLLVDINGGVRGYNSLGGLDALLTNFKKVSTMASLSVVIQQPSSLPRAMSVIDAKYFAHKPKLNNLSDRWAEIQKYAPIAILKEMGGYDTGTGRNTGAYIQSREYSGIDKIKGFMQDKNYRDGAFGMLAAKADEITWVQIWEACCREQLAEYNKTVKKKLTMKEFRASDELMKRVGDRFDYVITRTQVYDSVLSRSAHMRSKDSLSKMATAFLAEPTTVLNMLTVAAAKTAAGEKGAGRIIGSVVAATIINNMLASLVYAMRDDDEDKSHIEKYVTSFVEQSVDSINPLMMMPIARDVMSILQGYDVERTDMAIFADLYNSIQGLVPKEGKKITVDNVFGFAGSVSSLFGIPLRNIYRDTRGVFNSFYTGLKGERTTARGLLYAAAVGFPFVNSISDGRQLYDSLMSGDKVHYNRVMSRFKTESAAESALRLALRDSDKRIEKAAEAKLTGNDSEYDRIVSEIYAEGKLNKKDILLAASAELNEMKKDLEDTGKVIFFGDEMYSMTEKDITKLNENRTYYKNQTSGVPIYKSFTGLSASEREDALDLAEGMIEELAVYKTFGKTDSKAVRVASIVGLSEYSAYKTAIKGIESDKDRSGATINGSKKKKVIAVIKRLGLTADKQLFLLASSGYSIGDGDVAGMSAKNAKKRLLAYILHMRGTSQSEKAALAEMCGFEVRGNKVSMSLGIFAKS